MAHKGPIALAGCTALLLAAAWMQTVGAYAGDKSWLLLAAHLLIQGKRLYIDVVDVNPPLILWLYTIPVALSEHISCLRDDAALGAIGLCACALSLALSASLLKRHPFFGPDPKRLLQCVMLLALLLVFFTPPLYFFDREHVMLVLIFPYLLRFMPSLEGASLPLPLRIAVSLMAAVGFCIKPHSAVLFAALQGINAWRLRSPRLLGALENRIIYAAACLYLACVWFFAHTYLTEILPMALATYGAYNRHAIGIFYSIAGFILAGIALADFRLRQSTPLRADIVYFIGLAAAFFAYAWLNNGWGYTFHPLYVLLIFLSALIGWEHGWLKRRALAEGGSARRFIFGARACALNLLLVLAYALYGMALFFATPPCERSPDCRRNRPFVEYMAEHHARSFAGLGEDVHKWAWLARETGAKFAVRYNHLWMLPSLVSDPPDRATSRRWIVERVGRNLADDLNGNRPDIVFIDASRDFFGYGYPVDLIAFFSVVPEFKAAWARYRYADVIDGCAPRAPQAAPMRIGCRYTVYERLHE